MERYLFALSVLLHVFQVTGQLVPNQSDFLVAAVEVGVDSLLRLRHFARPHLLPNDHPFELIKNGDVVWEQTLGSGLLIASVSTVRHHLNVLAIFRWLNCHNWLQAAKLSESLGLDCFL